MAESPWALIRALARPQRRLLLLYGLALGVATSLPLASSVLLGRFVRLSIDRAPTALLVRTGAAYSALGLGSALVTVLVTWRATIAAWGITNGLRHDLTDYVLRADLGFHRDRTPGELVTRVDADITSMTEFLGTVVAQVVAIITLGIGALVVGTILHPLLAPALLTAFVLIGSITWAMRNRSATQTIAERAAEADMMSVVEQYLAGADDVAALGAGAHGVGRVGERGGRVVDAVRLRVREQMTMQGSVRVVVGVSQAIMIGYGAVMLSRHRLDVPAVVFGFRLLAAVAGKVDHLTWRLQDSQGAAGAARRVLELVAEQRIVRGGTALLPDGPLDVRFDHVRLVYDDAEGESAALHDLTLAIGTGRLVGVVGRTGSGKTSLARLLLRLVEPSSGRVLLGGIDAATVDEDELRRKVTAVPQDVQLFPGSVLDNVALFGDCSRDDVQRAIDDVGLGPWLATLAQGLDTLLASDDRDAEGTRVGLSSGQAQLLALSRALLRDPQIVVLDEATSRVDPATQDALAQAMRRLVHGRTAVVIAHRLETLDLCDDIAVLERGDLVEYGTRVALAADPTSRYARLRAAGAASEELS